VLALRVVRQHEPGMYIGLSLPGAATSWAPAESAASAPLQSQRDQLSLAVGSGCGRRIRCRPGGHPVRGRAIPGRSLPLRSMARTSSIRPDGRRLRSRRSAAGSRRSGMAAACRSVKRLCGPRREFPRLADLTRRGSRCGGSRHTICNHRAPPTWPGAGGCPTAPERTSNQHASRGPRP
jgi:hypothetical protein